MVGKGRRFVELRSRTGPCALAKEQVTLGVGVGVEVLVTFEVGVGVNVIVGVGVGSPVSIPGPCQTKLSASTSMAPPLVSFMRK